MSYDLAVWAGQQPESIDAATAEFVRRFDAMEVHLQSGTVPPPAPELVAFVDAALTQYSDLGEDSGPECPWASGPLIGEVSGDFIYLAMTYSGAPYARDALAEIANSLGLVCYDPQIARLLPDRP